MSLDDLRRALHRCQDEAFQALVSFRELPPGDSMALECLERLKWLELVYSGIYHLIGLVAFGHQAFASDQIAPDFDESEALWVIQEVFLSALELEDDQSDFEGALAAVRAECNAQLHEVYLQRLAMRMRVSARPTPIEAR